MNCNYQHIFSAIICALTVFSVSDAQAQWNPWFGGGYRHASTAQEGYLTGAARLMAGRGIYLDNLGNFYIKREQARGLRIDNWDHAIRTRWAIKDDYKARNKPENYLDRRERLLNQAERKYALDQREAELREKGVLPPKKKGYFVVKGKKFHSIEEWRASPEYRQVRMEAQIRELNRLQQKKLDEARRQEAVEFGRMWSKMSWLAREQYTRLSPEKKARYKLEWKYPDLKWKRLKEEDARRFYEKRPHLIPRGKQPYSQLPKVPPGVEEAFNRDLYQKNPHLIPKAGTNGLPPLPDGFKYRR